MKKAVICLCLFILLGAGGAYFLIETYNDAIDKPLLTDEKIKITVKKGDSLYSLLERLHNDKKIKNPIFFKLYLRRNNIITDIKPGEYEVTSDANINDLLKELEKGTERESIKFTLIEGWNIEQIADSLERQGIVTREDFMNALENYELPEYVQVNEGMKYPMEGYLYPDTYEFFKDVTAEQIVKILNKRFENVIEEVQKENNITVDNIQELMTLASIVEKEAVLEEDRAKIASVYLNRMKIDMPLQSCPTVIYSVGNEFYQRDKLIVLNKDLEVDSPYNTYREKGLPPGPIGAARKSSINAVINPIESDYLYFIAKNDGSHFFTKDYNEFLKVKMETQGY